MTPSAERRAEPSDPERNRELRARFRNIYQN